MRILKTAFIALLLFCLAVFDVSATEKSLDLKFSSLMNEENFTYSFSVWQSERQSDENYYLSLPAHTEGQKLTAVSSERIKIDGIAVNNDIVLEEGVHTVSQGDKNYLLQVMYSADIPAIFIETETGSLENVHKNKANKEKGTIVITDGMKMVYNGKLDYIKGRGNSTWEMAKKPYNIKLDEKISLFGMEKNKSWSLLANYEDITGVKNTITLDLAQQTGVKYNSQSVQIDLYINGEYMGMYTLIEKVEIDEGRIDITNLEELTEEANEGIDIEECEPAGDRGSGIGGNMKYIDIPYNPQDITGGYLLEFDFRDRYYNELSGFSTGYTTPIVIKSPEYATKAQVEYIAAYYQQFEDAVRSEDGYNSAGEHYSQFLDVESAAKTYLINEFSKNRDAGLSSTYIYKDINEKMYMGPVWDYDLSFGIDSEEFGVRNDVILADPTGMLVSKLRVNKEATYTIYALLCCHNDFRELTKEQWQYVFSPLMNSFVTQYDNLTADTEKSAVINVIKWATEERLGGNSPRQMYKDEVARVRQFIIDRAEYMDMVFGNDSYYICYKLNGKKGELLDSEWYSKGDTAVVLEYTTDEDPVMICWNTTPDGSGINYMPGESIEMRKSIVLYAQWEEPSAVKKILSFFASLFK